MVHTCNANTLEVEAGGSGVQSHPQPPSDCEHKLLRPFLNKRKEGGEREGDITQYKCILYSFLDDNI